ncbi:MAG: yerB [Frankiales bacterium]|nr:yerB [Frankiales bacterium]
MGDHAGVTIVNSWPGIACFGETAPCPPSGPYGRIVFTRSLPVIAALSVLAAGCGGSAHAVVTHVAAPSALPSSAAPSPSKAAVAAATPITTDPLTGLAPRTSPIVVIKVDNATTARRYQKGLGHAAIVYQELVESGQTRFAAVYDNAYSGEVGPIRSVRETDLELLPQYGRVAVAFSGGNSGIKGQFRSAVASGKLLDASYDVLPHDYRLAERRVDARNFYSTPARLAAAANGATATDIGLRFGPIAPTAGKPVTSARIPFSDMMVVSVRYDASSGTWSVFQDGTAMPGVAPANIVVQSVPIKRGRYVDVLGSPSPYATTVGHGAALILRNGRLVHATWKRASVKSGTHYVDDKGHDIPLKAGSTWVFLQPKTQSTSVS